MNCTACMVDGIGHESFGGYRRLRMGPRLVMAHRLVYELCFGPVPPGRIVMHKCDNPRCCNPEHLMLGDDLLNAQDRKAKGRYSGMKQLTIEQVRKIRELIKHGHSDRALAEAFGVQRPTITRLRLGYTYAKV